MKTQTITSAEVEQYERYIETQMTALAGLTELQKALSTHQGKIVNKQFFEKNFPITTQYGTTYPKYNISTPQITYKNFKLRIYVSRDCEVDLETRNTAEIVSAINTKIQSVEHQIEQYKEKIENFSKCDEEALKNDLMELYNKHNKPLIWNKILESYDVKYPNN